jgi:hypothetical protein
LVGRRKPYTQRGIARVPCTRCGAPSKFQWQCCANDNLWLGLCLACDIELNRTALTFMRVHYADALMERYVALKSEA